MECLLLNNSVSLFYFHILHSNFQKEKKKKNVNINIAHISFWIMLIIEINLPSYSLE